MKKQYTVSFGRYVNNRARSSLATILDTNVDIGLLSGVFNFLGLLFLKYRMFPFSCVAMYYSIILLFEVELHDPSPITGISTNRIGAFEEHDSCSTTGENIGASDDFTVISEIHVPTMNNCYC